MKNDPATSQSDWSFSSLKVWRSLWGLLLVALVIRGGILVSRVDSLQADVDGYRWIAETLAEYQVFGVAGEEGNVRATAFRPPLYPWMLSWLVSDSPTDAGATGESKPTVSIWSVVLLHLILGLLTVAGTYHIARALLSPLEAWGAGLLVAMDPILLTQSTQVMTETLATALAVAVGLAWQRLFLPLESSHTDDQAAANNPFARPRYWLASGGLAVALSLGFLSRPTFFVWAFLLLIYLVGVAVRKRVWWPVVTAALVVAVMASVIGAWTVRNQRQLGHPVWATSHGGYTLLLGNNPLFYDYLEDDPEQPNQTDAWDAERFHRTWAGRYQSDPLEEDFWKWPPTGPVPSPQIDDEVADDALAYSAAKQTIHQRPAMFAWACCVRVARLWTPLPHATPGRSLNAVRAVGGYYFIFYAAMLGGLCRYGRRWLHSPWMAGLLLAVALTCLHSIYWSNMRMRAPVIPWMACVAAAAIGSREPRR
ncbi:hypothetical protein FF011L_01220 [Roseimaritima multifibrata]|uniref:Glycosyltransferase RgtA/B/C/D-like domain-containing protein n=1 Tax=Roseimaritima multifibrata TaxID=1930274 RepID=A0A517M930_9BACT|nr:hypothetical protein [Roseimaritima multifibrata]QDS91393.1 hypothetical protein FF011L_01220 [Roseimaritima multifibrata]